MEVRFVDIDALVLRIQDATEMRSQASSGKILRAITYAAQAIDTTLCLVDYYCEGEVNNQHQLKAPTDAINVDGVGLIINGQFRSFGIQESMVKGASYPIEPAYSHIGAQPLHHQITWNYDEQSNLIFINSPVSLVGEKLVVRYKRTNGKDAAFFIRTELTEYLYYQSLANLSASANMIANYKTLAEREKKIAARAIRPWSAEDIIAAMRSNRFYVKQ
jgi:hypothetical protein